MRVLLTGGTGFVGAELARTLLGLSALEKLYMVIRSRPGVGARERLERLYKHWQKFGLEPARSALDKVEVIDHDLYSGKLNLPGPVDYVIHSAASTDLGAPLIPP